jgi:hypothetical protein
MFSALAETYGPVVPTPPFGVNMNKSPPFIKTNSPIVILYKREPTDDVIASPLPSKNSLRVSYTDLTVNDRPT